MPSMTKGNAVPSFIPTSQVRLNRSRSRSSGWRVCTSVASTGSVGNTMAPAKPPERNRHLHTGGEERDQHRHLGQRLEQCGFFEGLK
jgi:hypothetical protein